MIALALILLLFGSIYSLIGGIQLVIVMFQESIWWGLAQFFIPFANILFMCFHFKEAWPPTKRSLIGLGCVIAAASLLARTELADVVSERGKISVATLLDELAGAASGKPVQVRAAVSGDTSLSLKTVGNYRGKRLVQGKGKTVRLLSDDHEGSKHQRFIIQLASGQTLLVAHNIDVGRRVEGLKVGDLVEFYGEYATNAEGGVIHWTHRDLKGRHPNGWLRLRGVTYQ